MTRQMMHIAIAIGLVERMQDADVAKAFSKNGRNLSAKAARKYLGELRAKGYEFVPPCDDCDEIGRCRGHHQSDTGSES